MRVENLSEKRSLRGIVEDFVYVYERDPLNFEDLNQVYRDALRALGKRRRRK